MQRVRLPSAPPAGRVERAQGRRFGAEALLLEDVGGRVVGLAHAVGDADAVERGACELKPRVRLGEGAGALDAAAVAN
jgi:hypothetical protein